MHTPFFTGIELSALSVGRGVASRGAFTGARGR